MNEEYLLAILELTLRLGRELRDMVLLEDTQCFIKQTSVSPQKFISHHAHLQCALFVSRKREDIATHLRAIIDVDHPQYLPTLRKRTLNIIAEFVNRAAIWESTLAYSVETWLKTVTLDLSDEPEDCTTLDSLREQYAKYT